MSKEDKEFWIGLTTIIGMMLFCIAFEEYSLHQEFGIWNNTPLNRLAIFSIYMLRSFVLCGVSIFIFESIRKLRG